MSNLTASQRAELENLAHQLQSDYAGITEVQAIGRIALITGRNWLGAIKGLRILQGENMLRPSFIDAHSAGVVERMARENSNFSALLDRFDLIPRKTEFCGYCKPLRFSVLQLSEKILGEKLGWLDGNV